MWKEMAAQGWLGIHLPEEFGGQGFGLFELAVLLEETGSVAGSRARCCPPWPPRRWWPRPPTPDQAGADPARADRREHPGHPRPSATPASRWSSDGPTGEIVVSGTLRPLLGASTASIGAGPGPPDRRDASSGACSTWPDRASRVRITPLASLDPTRRVGVVEVDAVTVGVGATAAVAHHPAGRRGGGHPDGRRACRRRPVVPRDGHRVRQGPGPVRPTHRAVPGGQAPAGRHGHQGRADDRGGLGRGRWPSVPVGSDDAGLAAATAGALALDGYALGRQGVPAAAGRDRLHLGARRPPPPEAGHGRPPADGRARRLLRGGGHLGPGRCPAGPGRRPARPRPT